MSRVRGRSGTEARRRRVKLLFDANLSHKLVEQLSDVVPESAHVRDFDLESALDQDILDHAAEHGFVIVSKDEDLHESVLVSGPPPKVVWVRLGNCTTQEVARIIRRSVDLLAQFEADEEAAFLVLGRPTT